MHSRVRLVLLAVGLVAAALAGCVTPATDTSTDVAAASATSDVAVALRAAPVPDLDGARVRDWLATFVGDHAPRITGTPSEKEAAAALAGELADLGYTVEDHSYSASGLPSADGPFRAIVGVKPGTTLPEEWVVLGAHYDTSFTLGNPDVPGLPFGTGLTLQAAYDNGSGTALVMELARLLANVTMERTLVVAFFNGEEEGLVASGAYADELVASGVQVQAYVGFDMIGINWPSDAGCLCIYAGRAYAGDLNPLQEAVAFDLLGYPRANETVQVHDNHDTRNSDEASFASAGYPTMRWAGMARAGNYWAYHKLNDTVETMTAQAGGEDALLAGFETATASAYYSVLAVDRAARITAG